MRLKSPFHSNTRLFVCPKLLPTWRAGGKAFEWTMQYSVKLYCIAYVPGLSCISTEKHSPLLFSLCIPVHCPPSPSLCCLTTCFLQATKNIHLTFVTGRCFLCKHKYLEKFTKDQTSSSQAPLLYMQHQAKWAGSKSLGCCVQLLQDQTVEHSFLTPPTSLIKTILEVAHGFSQSEILSIQTAYSVWRLHLCCESLAWVLLLLCRLLMQICCTCWTSEKNP